MAKTRDLFDDTTMSFGEHLEVLRVHLFKAIIGLILAMIVTLMIGDKIVNLVRGPIDRALEKYGGPAVQDDFKGLSGWEAVKGWLGIDALEDVIPAEEPVVEADPRVVTLEISARALASVLHEIAPEATPDPSTIAEDRKVSLDVAAPQFEEIQIVKKQQNRAVTLTVQEAFVSYLKVSLVSGLVISSPWIFYQLWLFVAAGLYPHERKYVHLYLPMSILLFMGGAVFCFYLVFPFVLKFLLGFNALLNVTPQIRLSEWISFAIMLPLMFGISFQLPLVMLFLDRISVFRAKDYREKRRLAILVMSFIAMILTPADPMSMLLMLFPLLLLYELGIIMCARSPVSSSPFGDATPA